MTDNRIRNIQKLLKLALLSTTAVTSSACTGLTASNIGYADSGRILISSDSKGMESFGDVLNGLVNNTKTPPEIPSEHYQLRKEQTRIRGLRLYKAQSKRGEK